MNYMNFSNKKYKYNSFGLRERDLKHIRVALFAYEKIQNAVIFGSRAMGNYKKASDIDIAIFGKDIKRNIVGRLSGLLNYELPIPYFVEVVLDIRN